MKRIAFFHPIVSRGGGDAVFLNMVESLQDDYEIDIFTISDPDFHSLNNYFDISVDPTALTVRRLNPLGKILNYSSSILKRTTGTWLGRIHASFFGRIANRFRDEYDLMISTGDFPFYGPSIQYIHFPRFGRPKIKSKIEPDTLYRNTYDRVCQRVAGFDVEKMGDSTIVTNSEWTAGVVEDIYGEKPKTVYPPVNVSGFSSTPWNERESGFISVGRIERSKNILRTIEIIKGLRNQGHDVHLHVIGSPSDKRYYKKVKNEIEKKEFLYLEGEMSREKLLKLISTHKYGIHGMEHEHFGIAVAELVAGGTIPFVHDSGGPREIINHNKDLLYKGEEDAINKIERVLCEEDKRKEIHEDLPDIKQEYGRKRFQNEIANLANKIEREG